MEKVETLKPNVGGARNIARKLLKDAKVSTVPISLAKVLTFLKTQHNLEVVRFDFAETVSGMLVTIGDESTIGFNTNHSWVRRRFTIAHEIGHLLMGHACVGSERKSNTEVEANQFAAELLVPLSFIKKDYRQDPNVDRLSSRYVVSKEVLCIHLMECRLIR